MKLIYKYLKEYSDENVIERIYSEADIISLHIPLNDSTTYLLNDQFIYTMTKF